MYPVLCTLYHSLQTLLFLANRGSAFPCPTRLTRNNHRLSLSESGNDNNAHADRDVIAADLMRSPSLLSNCSQREQRPAPFPTRPRGLAVRRFGIASAPAGVPGTHSWRSLEVQAPPPTPPSGMAWASLAGTILLDSTHSSHAPRGLCRGPAPPRHHGGPPATPPRSGCRGQPPKGHLADDIIDIVPRGFAGYGSTPLRAGG